MRWKRMMEWKTFNGMKEISGVKENHGMKEKIGMKEKNGMKENDPYRWNAKCRKTKKMPYHILEWDETLNLRVLERHGWRQWLQSQQKPGMVRDRHLWYQIYGQKI